MRIIKKTEEWWKKNLFGKIIGAKAETIQE